MDYECDAHRVHLIVDHRVDARYDPSNLWPETRREPAQTEQFEIVDHRVDTRYDPSNLWPETRREAAQRDQLEISLNHKSACRDDVAGESPRRDREPSTVAAIWRSGRRASCAETSPRSAPRRLLK